MCVCVCVCKLLVLPEVVYSYLAVYIDLYAGLFNAIVTCLVNFYLTRSFLVLTNVKGTNMCISKFSCKPHKANSP